VFCFLSFRPKSTNPHTTPYIYHDNMPKKAKRLFLISIMMLQQWT
jgi:hypothetical protein